jgi:hypothetical protein
MTGRVILRSMMDIGGHVAQLRKAGAGGLDQYEARLRDNAGNPDTLANLFCEGPLALMFLQNDWQVTLRERPDLQLGLQGDVLHAEVRRFCEKKQDRLNDRAMLDAPDDLLVPCGDKENSCLRGRRGEHSCRCKRQRMSRSDGRFGGS